MGNGCAKQSARYLQNEIKFGGGDLGKIREGSDARVTDAPVIRHGGDMGGEDR